jgi:hypothetical protein
VELRVVPRALEAEPELEVGDQHDAKRLDLRAAGQRELAERPEAVSCRSL